MGERERERERERKGEREGEIATRRFPGITYRRTMVALALVGVVSVDVPVRCTNRTEGKTL